MGYMGFGMRKEVYTRKPKAAFKKIKNIYGKNPVLPKSIVKFRPDKHKPHKQKRPVHIADTASFKVFIFFILVGMVLIMMHVSRML